MSEGNIPSVDETKAHKAQKEIFTRLCVRWKKT